MKPAYPGTSSSRKAWEGLSENGEPLTKRTRTRLSTGRVAPTIAKLTAKGDRRTRGDFRSAAAVAFEDRSCSLKLASARPARGIKNDATTAVRRSMSALGSTTP